MRPSLQVATCFRSTLRCPRAASRISSVPAWHGESWKFRSISSTQVSYARKKDVESPTRAVKKALGKVNAAGTTNPNDFTQMEQEIALAQSSLQDNLSTLRAGGRFNHELLESLKVQLKSTKQHVKLGDLAQVIPKSGRQILVIVGEEAHIKAISTAIQSSQYSLNPAPNPQNPLELLVPIPPPTAESRKQVVAEADKAADKAYHVVKQARGAQQKKINAMGIAKTVPEDDLAKARKSLDKDADAANKKIKEMLEKAKKTLQG